MDIRTLLERPTAAERVAIDSVIGAEPDGVGSGRVVFGGHPARSRRELLLPALHAAQDASGSVTRGALGYISERLTVPPAEAYGVATFYALFNTDRPGGGTTHVCDDLVCARRGAEALLDRINGGRVERSPCLGQCDRAPAILFHEPGTGYGTSAPADAFSGPVFDDLAPGFWDFLGEPRLLRRVGTVDPESLDAYRSSGGYETLTRVIERGAEWALAELEASGLRGRGGAAFPIGLKWRGVADAPGPVKYVIANGDESEPGTFKDRVLMEGDPYALVEAMTVYGLVTGARRGFIYVRGEYPTAERRLRNAVASAREAGLLGDDVAGSGAGFDLEIRRGAGAYICGEETALFASIEGHRGEPRQKPPFPTEAGVFGRPTGINNIETLLAALEVLSVGADAFSAIGTEQSKGPKLFCVSGAVVRPGVYEVPFGTTLGALLDLAGGVSGGLGAVLLGGAAGTFVTADALETPLTFEGTRAIGAGLGSGSIIVFDDQTDFGSVLLRIARFFRDESCGQCTPCRIGTVRQEEALIRLEAGSPLGSAADELARLDDLALVMTQASICGLGQTASAAISSARRLGLWEPPS